MACPLCGSRKARRACPALDRTICAVCCGTKRLVEIACPSDCVYLTTARAHPPAVVARQRERDFRFAMAMVHKLPERPYHVLLILQQAILRHQATAVPSLVDADVAEAAGALASTFETAARGIIYEHQPASLPAQRLLNDLRNVLADLTQKAGRALERDAALALRRIEQASREARAGIEDVDTAYLAFLARLPSAPVATGASEEPAPPGGRAGRQHAEAPGGGIGRIVLP